MGIKASTQNCPKGEYLIGATFQQSGDGNRQSMCYQCSGGAYLCDTNTGEDGTRTTLPTGKTGPGVLFPAGPPLTSNTTYSCKTSGAYMQGLYLNSDPSNVNKLADFSITCSDGSSYGTQQGMPSLCSNKAIGGLIGDNSVPYENGLSLSCINTPADNSTQAPTTQPTPTPKPPIHNTTSSNTSTQPTPSNTPGNTTTAIASGNSNNTMLLILLFFVVIIAAAVYYSRQSANVPMYYGTPNPQYM